MPLPVHAHFALGSSLGTLARAFFAVAFGLLGRDAADGDGFAVGVDADLDGHIRVLFGEADGFEARGSFAAVNSEVFVAVGDWEADYVFI